MDETMTRREAIGTGLMGLSAAIELFSPGMVYAGWSPSVYYLLGPGWDQYNRRTIVSQAMAVLDQRLFDPAIAANARQNGDYPFMTVALMARAARDAHPYFPDYPGVLWRQLAALRNAQIKPVMFITADYRPDRPREVSWGHYDQVQVRFANAGFASWLAGNFNIALNTFLLGGSCSEPCFWASAIAHEMLHNLGHAHDDDSSNSCYEWRQMITFQYALYFNGHYGRGMKIPFYGPN
jgi:hypothetical protein